MSALIYASTLLTLIYTYTTLTLTYTYTPCLSACPGLPLSLPAYKYRPEKGERGKGKGPPPERRRLSARLRD